MSRNRIYVEKIREILRLKFELYFSIREIAKTLKVSKTSIVEYIAEFNRTSQLILSINIYQRTSDYLPDKSLFCYHCREIFKILLT